MVGEEINKISIKIPKELYEKIQNKISGTSFTSVEVFVVNTLEKEFPAEPVYTKEEEELIKARLRKLGYIE